MISMCNVGTVTASREKMVRMLAEAAFREAIFVVASANLARSYSPPQLLKQMARAAMGSNDPVSPNIVVKEDGDNHLASGKGCCPILGGWLVLEANIVYSDDSPGNDPKDLEDQEPIIDEVRLVSVTVRLYDQAVVIPAELLEQSFNALCEAENFPAELMKLDAELWKLPPARRLPSRSQPS